MKVSMENDNNIGYEKITIVVDNILLSSFKEDFFIFDQSEAKMPLLTMLYDRLEQNEIISKEPFIHHYL